MRHRYVLLFLLILFLAVVTAAAQAQQDPVAPDDQKFVVIENPLGQNVDASIDYADEARRVETLTTPLYLLADEPSDFCADAPPLIVGPENPADGNASSVIDATTEASDPQLTCMWDDPPRLRGYRTVWYELVAPASGTVTLDTFNSGYDTVLGVFTGSCEDLRPLHCNDDINGFTSELSVVIQEGETYYVEVADYRPGLVDDPTLQLAALLEPVTSKWENAQGKPATRPVTRHAVVSQGQFIYVVGGKTGGIGIPEYSNELRRYDTISGRWEGMQQMPGVGYANTTAVLFNNRIYLPTGDNGNNVNYNGNHWAYDILKNSWQQLSSIPRNILPNGRYFAYSAAVVPPSRNRYYVTGGMTSQQELSPTANVSAETYVYFPGTDSWARQKPMQAARYAHTAAWVETKNLGICVAGGLGTGTVDGEPVTILHRSVECYQPGGDWRYIGDLNVPRYGAGSVVAPNGNWYVFGGITFDENGLQTVARTEVYNPRLGTWSVMDPSYNLGTYRTMPPRFWPRGAMVGDYLWVMGGSIFNEGEEAVPLIDSLHLPSPSANSAYFPVGFGDYSSQNIPDDAFPTARFMAFGGMQRRNFDQQRDFFDYYYFDLNSNRRVTITLEVPDGNNFDMELYGQGKLLWDSSTNPLNGIDESMSLVLAPRRYYIRVIRRFPTAQPDKSAFYTLRLN